MQMLLFAVGEGVRDRILASDDISLNANLAKYREDIKAGRVRKNRNRSSELNGKKPIAEAPKSRVAGRTLLLIKQSGLKMSAPPNETYAKLAILEKSGMMNKKGVEIMNKDTIIKVLLAIIALMVFAWLWRIISGMLIGTLVLTTSLLSVLIALIIQIVLPIAVIVFAVKLFTKKK